LKQQEISNKLIREDCSLPGDDGGEEETVEGVFGDGDGDGEVVGGEEAEHGGDGLLHGVAGGGGHAFGDGGVVEGLDASEHGSDDGEAAVEIASGDGVVREAVDETVWAETAAARERK